MSAGLVLPFGLLPPVEGLLFRLSLWRMSQCTLARRDRLVPRSRRGSTTLTELVAQGALTPSESASLSPRYMIAESVPSELNIGGE